MKIALRVILTVKRLIQWGFFWDGSWKVLSHASSSTAGHRFTGKPHHQTFQLAPATGSVLVRCPTRPSSLRQQLEASW